MQQQMRYRQQSPELHGSEAQRGGGRNRSEEEKSQVLSRPDDRRFLSDLMCFLRSHVEAFVATSLHAGDGAAAFVAVGRVGIRCVHCARLTAPATSLPGQKRGAAESYPKNVRLVYQAVRNWQRYHLTCCPSMPEEARREYAELKGKKIQKRSSRRSPTYWEDCCRLMGMIDTEDGIRLRTGEFIVSGNDGGGFVDGFSEKAVKPTENRAPLKGSGSVLPEAGVAKGTEANHSESQIVSLEAVSDDIWDDPGTVESMREFENSALALASSGCCNAPSSTPNASQNAIDTDALFSPAEDLIDKKRPTGTLLSPAGKHIVPRNSSDHDPLPPADQLIDELKSTLDADALLSHAKSETNDSQNITSTLLSAAEDLNASQDSAHALLSPADQLVVSHNTGTQAPPDKFQNNVSQDATGILLSSAEDLITSHNDNIDTDALLSPGEDLIGTKVPIMAVFDEAVLGKVRLAQSVVQSVKAMRQVPPDQVGQQRHHMADARSEQKEEDLASLGADLYELFSGINPTDLVCSDDEEDATTDIQPEQRQKKKEKRREVAFVPLCDLGFPPALSSLVSSLLGYDTDGKGRQNVYVSIDEAEEDLSLMVARPEQFLSRRVRSDFQLAEMHRLYGREEDESKLLGAFDRATRATAAAAVSNTTNNTAVFVTGYSGTGKSALVESVRRRFVERGARFVSGKFDLMRNLQPLSAVVSALDDYCDQLARDDDEDRVEGIRAELDSILGSEAGALANLIPGLRKIVRADEAGSGAHHQSAGSFSGSGGDATQRLVFLFRSLFHATCCRSSPVVLVLDDLQWADDVSLELMQALVTDSDLEGLLFIGCFRDNEVGADHPLMSRMDAIRRSSCVDVTTISVDNLGVDSVNALVSGILCLTPRMTRSLAEVVFRKTGGNALFVVQLLSSLHDEGLLRFSLTSRRWEWDIAKIRDKGIADNVVELMTAKLMRLAPEVRDAVKVAAAFGAQCQEALLAILDRAPDCIMNIVAALDIATEEGVMVKSSDSVYSFSHDQIQDAAYHLIPESQCAAFHLRIGRLLCKASSAAELETFLFSVVDQMHRGSELIQDPDERITLVQMSLLAGQMASNMSAFLPASAYLKAGLKLLFEEDWEQHRDLCMDLYIHCAETEYVNGAFEDSIGRLEVFLGRAKTLEESVRAYYIKVQTMGAQGRTGDAIDTAMATLSLLGEAFPSHFSDLLLKEEMQATKNLFSWKADESLLLLGTMDYFEKQEAMKLLNLLIYYVFTEKIELLPFVTSRMVRLSLLHGFCRESAFGFATFGMVVCGVEGDLAGGHRCGKIALALLERFQATEQLAKVYVTVNRPEIVSLCSSQTLLTMCLAFSRNNARYVAVYGTVSHWVEPIQSSLECLKHAVSVGSATGDTEFAMLASHQYLGTALCSGKALATLICEDESYSKQMLECKQHFTYMNHLPMRQAMLILRHGCGDSTKTIRAVMEGKMNNNVEEKRARGPTFANHVLTNFFCMWLEYIFCEYELCWETAQKNKELPRRSPGRFPYVCNHVFYSGLVALELARKEYLKAEYITVIEEAITQMRTWAKSTQWNCQHKLDLLNAEYAYLKGDIIASMELYNVAIKSAAEHLFVHEHALALERAGIFYQENGDQSTAIGYFRRAYDSYTQWGATGKVAHVREKYLT